MHLTKLRSQCCPPPLSLEAAKQGPRRAPNPTQLSHAGANSNRLPVALAKLAARPAGWVVMLGGFGSLPR